VSGTGTGKERSARIFRTDRSMACVSILRVYTKKAIQQPFPMSRWNRHFRVQQLPIQIKSTCFIFRI
jgi:hypothetical protein